MTLVQSGDREAVVNILNKSFLATLVNFVESRLLCLVLSFENMLTIDLRKKNKIHCTLHVYIDRKSIFSWSRKNWDPLIFFFCPLSKVSYYLRLARSVHIHLGAIFKSFAPFSLIQAGDCHGTNLSSPYINLFLR